MNTSMLARTLSVILVLLLFCGGCGAGRGGSGGIAKPSRAALAPPLAPRGLRAGQADRELIIDWIALQSATHYDLYWSTVRGFTPAEGTKIRRVTSPYVHTGLSNETTYYYIVIAINADGESEPSIQASGTPEYPVRW